MAAKKKYELTVIGSGPGGYVAAIRAAQLGLSTALVEREQRFGGTCLNIGCIPSKVLLDSSELYFRLRQPEQLAARGIRIGKPELDLGAMMRRKGEIVERFTAGVASLLEQNGIDTFRGTGRLAGGGQVEVVGPKERRRLLETRVVILATGSVSATLAQFPAGEKGFVTSTEALAFEQAPERLVVVGGGAIGLELGSVWARLGTSVAVVELMDQILPGMDAEVARGLKRSLERQGIEIHTSTRVQGYSRSGATIKLEAERLSGGKLELAADAVLVAVGRRPYTEGLGLREAGVEVEQRSGRVVVDEGFRTSAEGVYAVGDLIRGPMLAHKAEEEGIACAELVAGQGGEVNYEAIPSVVYTWPEAASVGRGEAELKSAGVDYLKGSFPFRLNGRAQAMGSEEGLVKVLADRHTDRVLGVHILGPWASDLISEAVTVMEFGGSAEDMARTVHAHPTLPEALKEAALAVAGRAIHAAPESRRPPPG